MSRSSNHNPQHLFDLLPDEQHLVLKQFIEHNHHHLTKEAISFEHNLWDLPRNTELVEQLEEDLLSEFSFGNYEGGYGVFLKTESIIIALNYKLAHY